MNLTKKYTFVIILLCGFYFPKNFAQNILTKADAVKITLENNYDIKLARQDIQLAQTNTKKELNGYNPTVNASAGANATLGSSSQKFSNGGENEVSNAFNYGANAAVNANYTLLDKTRDLNIAQLQEIVALSDIQLRQAIENNLLQVFTNYYEVARLTQNTNVFNQTLEVSQQRLLRAQYRYDYGQGIRLDVLNAEVDIQRDSINLLNANNLLANSKRNLNVAMGREVSTEVAVDTLVTYDPTLTLQGLIQDAQSKNFLIHLINQNMAITALDFDIIEAGKKPTVGATAGYNFSFSDNAAGSFIDFSTNRGLTAGLNLNWNIYDGGRRSVQKELVQINVATQLLQKEQLQLQLERDVTNAWENYQNARYILQAEEKNLAINQLNFERTEEQFKVGQVNSVEFRQAQLNLFNAATSLNTAKFDAKLIELQLLQLSGRLLEVEF